MYWTDWGKKPNIKTADSDGNNVQTLVEEGLGWPNGLTIDYAQERLYWADAQTDV